MWRRGTATLFTQSVWPVSSCSRDWLVRSPRRLAAIGRTGAIVMIGLGTGLAVSGRND